MTGRETPDPSGYLAVVDTVLYHFVEKGMRVEPGTDLPPRFGRPARRPDDPSADDRGPSADSPPSDAPNPPPDAG